MRAVFYGSGRFAVPSFEAVCDAGHEVAALVTQPDRGKGRGRALAPPPLKPVAARRGIRVLQPPRVKAPEVVAELASLAPEAQLVVAYGQILPRAVLELAPGRTLNVHASLLPRYRGAAPIQWAVARGERETGVTTMLVDEGLDTGPILLQRSLAIADGETAEQLEPRLAALGAELLVETLRGLGAGSLAASPQDDSRATLAPLLRKQDGRADWSRPAEEIANRIRGFSPWPGVHASLRGRPLRLVRAVAVSGAEAGGGVVIAVERDAIDVACGAGSALRLLEVQPESRRPMAAADFARGARVSPGDRFESFE